MTAFILSLLGFGVLGLACYACYHAGKSDQRARELDEQIDASRKASSVRDRLRRDAAFAGRVRGRFTR